MLNTFLQKKYLVPVLFGTVALGGGIILLTSIAGSFITEATQDVQIEIATTTRAVVEEKAPSFVLSTLNEKRVALEEYQGKPLVIVFWSSWNTASTDQLSLLDQIPTEKYPDVQFVAINVQEDKSIVANFIGRSGYRTEILLDETGKVAESYRAFSIPATYFIDRAGYIRSIAFGVLSEEMLLRDIESVIQ